METIYETYSKRVCTKGKQIEMSIEELMQKYKKEKCAKCNKNIDCKILVKGNRTYCTEEEE